MTTPFVMHHNFEVVTASASVDPANGRRGVVNFVVDAHLYSFAMHRAAMPRLGRQIERLPQELPPLACKR